MAEQPSITCQSRPVHCRLARRRRPGPNSVSLSQVTTQSPRSRTLFTHGEMSPPRPIEPPTDRARLEGQRLASELGTSIRHERVRRGWTMRQLAAASRLSAAEVARLESGSAGSLEAYARLAVALGLRPEIVMAAHQRRRSTTVRAADPVHSAMGELEAARLRGRGLHVAVDEPYQHFQFAGQADVVAWDTERLALRHLENRTRFPDLQAAAGAFNAKRAYLGQALAERLGIRGWRHETHVIVALWSAEVLHVVRLRRASFEALCPTQPTRSTPGGAAPETPRTNTHSPAPRGCGRDESSACPRSSCSTRPHLHGHEHGWTWWRPAWCGRAITATQRRRTPCERSVAPDPADRTRYRTISEHGAVHAAPAEVHDPHEVDPRATGVESECPTPAAAM